MKRCPICEESYNDTWKKCLKDDSPLDDVGGGSQKIETVQVPDRTERYKGVGGWLGLFVWALLLAGPIHFVLIVYQLATGSGYFIYPADLPYTLNIVYALLALLEVMGAILLFRPKISSVIFIRAILMLWAIFRPISFYVTGDKGLNAIISILLGFLIDFAWLLYFFFSKRVRIRYYLELLPKKDALATSFESYLRGNASR